MKVHNSDHHRDQVPRRISTIVAGLFRFHATIRKEGRRGRRITIPPPIIRGLRLQGWSRKMPLRVVLGDAAWVATARRMGGAIVLAVPAQCLCKPGDDIMIELWMATAVKREYLT